MLLKFIIAGIICFASYLIFQPDKQTYFMDGTHGRIWVDVRSKEFLTFNEAISVYRKKTNDPKAGVWQYGN